MTISGNGVLEQEKRKHVHKHVETRAGRASRRRNENRVMREVRSGCSDQIA